MSAGATGPDRGWLRDPGHCVALGFGVGLARHAPGTWGSLLGVGVYLAVAPLGRYGVLGILILMVAIGVPLCGRAARALGTHDHPAIVWDEVAGMVLTLVCGSGRGFDVVTGFLLFRFFDIWKPWPVRWADGRVGGGVGIMLDDLLAAGYAGLVLALFDYLSYS